MGYVKGQKSIKKFLWQVGGVGSDCDSNTATGVIPIFTTGANCLIHSVKAHVITLVAGSSAEEVGDGNDVDGFIVDGFAASTGVYPLSAEDATCGAYQKATTAGATDALDVSNSEAKKFYSASDTIDFKISGTASAGKIRFEIEYEAL